MSDRIYIDPVTHSAREERALFSLGKKLGKSVGQFYRLGIITYCRVKAEDGILPDDILEEFNLIMQKDPEYLERMKQDRIAGASICNTGILYQVKKDEPLIHVYNKITRSEEDIEERNFHPRMHERL